MHAIRQHEFGAPEVLRYEEVPDPEPGSGQVRIAVAAAGVHLIDTLLIQQTRAIGAYPVAAAGGQSKVDTTRRLGAAIAVDYTDPDWTDTVRESLRGKQITVAFDGVGGSLGRGALELLGPGGRL